MAKPLDYQRALVSSMLSTMAKNRTMWDQPMNQVFGLEP
jgi:hypothetical protein